MAQGAAKPLVEQLIGFGALYGESGGAAKFPG